MRTHCGHSTQLVSLSDIRNAGKSVAMCSSSVRTGLTGFCVCYFVLYGDTLKMVSDCGSSCSWSIAIRKTQV